MLECTDKKIEINETNFNAFNDLSKFIFFIYLLRKSNVRYPHLLKELQIHRCVLTRNNLSCLELSRDI